MAEGEYEQQYDLEPAPPPVQLPRALTMTPAMDLAQTDVLCRRCTFNLRGLTPERNCPECGFPIERTLQGDPLTFSPPAYLRTLSTGLKWILVTMLVQIGLSLAGIAIGIAVVAIMSARAGAVSPSVSAWVNITVAIITVPLNISLLYGWWKFSTPDPELMASGSSDNGNTPRVIVRWATVLLICMSVLSSVVTAVRSDTSEAQIDLFVVGVTMLSGLASITQFFASLFYLRWIAGRMQNPTLVATVHRYLWLLPLIYIVGLLCIGLGPIIAFIMYLLLLNQVRKGINFMIAQQALRDARLEFA